MENFEEFEKENLLLLSLGKAMKTEIKHIAYCLIRKKIDKNKPGKVPNVPVFACLGKDAAYFFRQKFDRPFLIFPYSKIDHVLIETKNKYTLMIVFNNENSFFFEEKNTNNENKYSNDLNIPYIHLTIPERNYFIENLMCYYSVFHISEKKSMRDLIIKKRDKFIFQNFSKNHIEYRKLYNMPPTNFKTIINRNYL